jgi:ribosomal protein S18 acetylase RimI-like enzyme
MKDIYYLGSSIRATACTMSVRLDEYDIDGYIITRIEVAPNLRGRGYGTRLLELVCYEADEEQQTLYLEVQPDGSWGSLTYDQLRKWYERYGFETFGALMRRFPRLRP